MMDDKIGRGNKLIPHNEARRESEDSQFSSISQHRYSITPTNISDHIQYDTIEESEERVPEEIIEGATSEPNSKETKISSHLSAHTANAVSDGGGHQETDKQSSLTTR